MNYSHNPQLFPDLRVLGDRCLKKVRGAHPGRYTSLGRALGLAALVSAAAGHGFTPAAARVLEGLRERIASGEAGEEAYAAFLDRLAEENGGDCGSWTSMPEARSEELRYAGLRAALAEACPGDGFSGRATGPDDGVSGEAVTAPARREKPRARLTVSHSLRPRSEGSPGGIDRLAGEGAFPGGSWRLGLAEGTRPDQRLLRVGAGGFALYAGQFHSSLETTRLGFVAGGRFYAGRSGASGIDGTWASRIPSLDGLAASARAGRWIAEAAGAWNRLTPRAGEANPGPDALLYQIGLARPEVPQARRRGAGADRVLPGRSWGLRMQAVHLRGEGGEGREGGNGGTAAPVDLTVAGLGLTGTWPGLARWNVGAAGSRIGTPRIAGVSGNNGGFESLENFGETGAYAEAALASAGLPESPGPKHARTSADSTSLDPGAYASGGAATWRLEVRQASAGWANPLHSPRGILRDTAGGWVLPGRGEGGAAARTRFPLGSLGAWTLALKTALDADWSSAGGPLAQSGALGLMQTWGDWTGESGASLHWRRAGSGSAAQAAALAGGAALPDDPGERAGLGWGQSLGWRQGDWRAKSAFTWKGEGYSGSQPASLSLGAGRTHGRDGCGGAEWSAAVLTGDIRKPESYLRADVREAWTLGRNLRLEHEIRLPWTPVGLGDDMAYQLRLEAAL